MLALLARIGIKGGVVAAVLGAVIFIPLLIWVATAVGFYRLLAQWKHLRKALMAGSLTCRLDTDCPPGFVCMDGRCVRLNGV